MFTSNNRQEAARASAQTAHGEAADAFVALDGTQRSVTMLVDAFANLDAGTAGRRLREELAPLLTAADNASASWIQTLDKHNDVLEQEPPDPRALAHAEQAFRAIRPTLDQARDHLERFTAQHHDIERRVQQAVAEVSPKSQAALQRLEAARSAVAHTRAAGVSSADLDAKLRRAEQLGAVVAAGPHTHGAAAALTAAGDLTTAAELIVRTAAQLQALVPDTKRRTASTATRLEGVAGRLEQVQPTLSALRRRFSSACSDDLDQVPVTGSAALEKARRLFAQAKDHAAAGAWETAASALESCRSEIAVAERGVNSVVERLRDLEAVAANPAEELERTRFVIRDAQKLVVAAGSRVPANEARVLDSLVARADAASQRLVGHHPDYWSYLTELRALRDLAGDVVRRSRAAVASTR